MQSIIQAVTDATNDVGADLDGLWVRDYCSGKLGPQGLNALGEMDSMTSAAMNVGISGKANSLFNIKKVDPGHKYVLTMQAADERKVPGAGLTYQVINHLTIRYTNRLGWAWTDTVSITGWQASLTVGVEADLKKKKIKPVPGITPGVDHLRIEFTSMIESERMMHYAGAADLSTAVTTFKPSASILVGVGASADLMYQVTFLTEPNALQFTERRGHVKTSGPKKKIKVSMTAEGGKGSAVATPSYDPVADLSSKPTPVKVTKTWDSVTVGPFETGKSDLPRGAAAALQGLQSAVAVWKAEEIDAAAPKLQELGFPPAPDFHLTIMVDGWASRRWRNAGKPGEKEAKNLVLSNIRARNVAALVSTIMGAGHRIDAQGHGEGVRVPEAMMRGSGPADLARLRSKAELIQVKDELTLRRRNLQLQVAAAEDDTRQDPGEREREIKKLNDEIFTIDYRLAEIQFYEQDRYGPNSDDETLRQVNVTASWEGYTVRLFDAGK